MVWAAGRAPHSPVAARLGRGGLGWGLRGQRAPGAVSEAVPRHGGQAADRMLRRAQGPRGCGVGVTLAQGPPADLTCGRGGRQEQVLWVPFWIHLCTTSGPPRCAGLTPGGESDLEVS